MPCPADGEEGPDRDVSKLILVLLIFRVFRLAERLLEKETISLPDIVEVLGPRPFPLKQQLLEYLEELK